VKNIFRKNIQYWESTQRYIDANAKNFKLVFFSLVVGLLGTVFRFTLSYIEDFRNHLYKNVDKSVFFDWILPIAFGILCVSIAIFLVKKYAPEASGSGVQEIEAALDNSYTLQFLLALFAGRLILTVFSYGIGLSGGIFAPILSLGVLLGMFFGTLVHTQFPGLVASPGIFAVAGMTGIFAATVKAPITGLILAAEMTSNFELLLPLIFTVASASLFTTMFGNQPIYTSLLDRAIEKSRS